MAKVTKESNSLAGFHLAPVAWIITGRRWISRRKKMIYERPSERRARREEREREREGGGRLRKAPFALKGIVRSKGANFAQSFFQVSLKYEEI